MKKLTRLVLFLLLPKLNACVALPIKHKRAISPKIEGIVVDAVTGKPIAGAKATLFPSPYHTAKSVANFEASTEKKFTYTSKDGTFKLNPIYETDSWFYIWLGTTQGICDIGLTIEHKDYTRENYRGLKEGVGYRNSASLDGPCISHIVVKVDAEVEPLNSSACKKSKKFSKHLVPGHRQYTAHNN